MDYKSPDASAMCYNYPITRLTNKSNMTLTTNCAQCLTRRAILQYSVSIGTSNTSRLRSCCIMEGRRCLWRSWIVVLSHQKSTTSGTGTGYHKQQKTHWDYELLQITVDSPADTRQSTQRQEYVWVQLYKRKLGTQTHWMHQLAGLWDNVVLA